MYELFVKRALDIVLSVLALVVLSPVLLVVGLMVRVKLGSPVVFKQVRPGKDAKLFCIYKFRTMTDARDSEGNLLPDADRLTSFGKKLRATSLDELPELWNILKGDMSLVGPRPLLVRDMVFFSESEMNRQKLRPGLTGLAQINGRNCAAWEAKLAYDVEYLSQVSLRRDAQIVWKTVALVLRREGISSDNHVTSYDLGDVMLMEGRITKSEYDEKIEEARVMLASFFEGSR